MSGPRRILALAGGVGGARLVHGLASRLGAEGLAVVVNTGDDFDHLGLRVCPDLDTVVYTLAGLNNPQLGWGLAGESWNFMAALERLGGEGWFRLGDSDLATHIWRTQRLATANLSTVTRDMCAQLGVGIPVSPMSDDPVRSIVETDEGRLAFQDYFVRRQARPRFLGISFEGVETARISAAFSDALADPALAAIIICPSNPLLSIRPILALPGVIGRLARRTVPVIAVSPFIGGEAVKGPAAKIMRELGHDPSAAGLADIYGGLLDGLVVDPGDTSSAPDRLAILRTDTLMRDADGQARLAQDVLDFAGTFPRRS